MSSYSESHPPPRSPQGSGHFGHLAAELKLMAERKLGEMLGELPKQHGARPGDSGP